MTYKKVDNTGILLKKKLVYVWLLVLVMFVWPVTSYGDEPPNRVPPNPDVGVADINMGLEAAHVSLTADHIGYKFLDANYQQAQNAGASWNRWKVDWSAVERQPGEFHWSCRVECFDDPDPDANAGQWFDYPRLAREDADRGIHSLVILDEIPGFYQAGSPVIEGLLADIFTTSSGTTDDPSDPTITGINPDNKWAVFVHQTMTTLGPLGVHHWQIMNELNINEVWGGTGGTDSYIRSVEIAAKIAQFRGVMDDVILSGITYDGSTQYGLDMWAEGMFDVLADNLDDFAVDAIALHPYERSKTSYDYPTNVHNFLAATYPALAEIPIWLTETGSSGCAGEAFAIVGPDGTVNCPPVEEQTQARSTDAEQAGYILQSMAYAFTVPEVDKYFQFHLHDLCPQGAHDGTSIWYRPGFGLYHNWPGYDYFVGGEGSNCAVTPYDGRKKPAYQAFAQTSRWLGDRQ